MSYVNLMANDVWSENDHVKRTEEMVRAHWMQEDENILNAKLWGQALGIQTLTAAEQADIADLKAVRLAAQQAGLAARADMARLSLALAYEATRRALAALPPDDPGAPALQAQLDAASADTLSLVADRDAYRAAQNPPDAAPEVAP